MRLRVKRCPGRGLGIDLIILAYAVLYGLGKVAGADGLSPGKIGDSSGQLEDAMKGASRKIELFHGGSKQAVGSCLHFTPLPNLYRRHLRITVELGPLKAFLLAGACPFHPGPNLPELSPVPSSVSFSYSTRGTSTKISMRSSRGPLIRFR